MATESGRREVLAVQAAADLTAQKFKVITMGGTIAAAADLARFAGILREGNNSGYNVSAVYEGQTKAIIGGAVSTVGWPLKVANSGYLVACASGDNGVIGRILEAATSGALCPVLVDFSITPVVWGG